MLIVLIVAVVATLFIAEGAAASPVAEHAGLRCLLAALGVAAVPLLAVVASKVVSRRLRVGAAESPRFWRSYRLVRRVHVFLWLAMVLGIAGGLEWPRIVRFNWHLDGVPVLDDLLILIPVLLPLVLSWAAFYEVDRAARGRARASGATGDGASAAPAVSLGEYLDLHVRHCLAIVLLPVLALLAVQDVVELLSPRMLAADVMPLVLVGAMLLFLGVFPIVLRRVWRTRPLEAGRLRDRLEALARQAGLEVGEILVWQTRSMVANAAVSGFTRRFRYVFLSDGLLDLLTEDQVVAVFGHELGHVRHRHLWLRAAAMFAPLSLGLFVYYAIPGPMDALGDGIRAAGLDLLGNPLGLAALAAMIVYVLTFFGYYSRCLEHEADLSICRCMPPDSGVSVLCSALERLGAAHGNRHERSWQHASIARRVEFLKSVEREPKLGLRFDRRNRLFGGIVIALSLSPVICLLLSSCLLS